MTELHVYRLAKELRGVGLDGMAERLEQDDTPLPTSAAIIARLRDLGRTELAKRVRDGDFDAA